VEDEEETLRKSTHEVELLNLAELQLLSNILATKSR